MNKVFSALLVLTVLLLAPHRDAGAQCDPPLVDGDRTVGAAPLAIGELHPINGFPRTILDTNNVAMELCLDGANCIFSPLEAGNPFSEEIGFGAEAFWWAAEGTIPVPLPVPGVPEGIQPIALVVMAAEAGFLGTVATGNQLQFTRLRIRIDAPFAGFYTVTHPFGQIIQRPVGVAGRRAINETFDIPFVAGEAAHQGRVGPFLVWEPLSEAPAGFVGNPFVEHAVSGSPCGTNEFRVSAENPIGTPIDLNGDAPGNDLVTDLFKVWGKLFQDAPTLPLTVDSASYSRPAGGGPGRVNVFVSSTSIAAVTAQKLPQMPLKTLTRKGGKFFTSFDLASTFTLPATVNVIAHADGFNDGLAVSPITDEVTIEIANYDIINRKLAIRAKSSDMRVVPTLTLSDGLGTIASGVTRVIANVLVPPARISVTSSAGGSETKRVSIVEPSSLLLMMPAILSGAQNE
jgi:hypothetical protein